MSTYFITTAKAPAYDSTDEDLGKLVIEDEGEWVATLGDYETIAGDGDILSLAAEKIEAIVADALNLDSTSLTAEKVVNAGSGEREWQIETEEV